MMRIFTFFCWALAVSLMAPAGPAWADEPAAAPSGSQGESAPRYVPLREALPTLTKQTGILFQVPESLQDEMIPWQEDGVNTPSMDWIQNFSHIDLVDEETGQRRIILMTSNSGSAPAASVPRKTARVKRIIPEAKAGRSDEPKPKLSREKLMKLGGALDRFMIRAWKEDAEYRAFFSANGVQTSGDFLNKRLVKKIRILARNLVIRMKVDPWSSSHESPTTPGVGPRRLTLSMEKAVKLGGIPKRYLGRAWEDPEYREFLSTLGVEDPADLERGVIVRKVREQARNWIRMRKYD